MDRSTTRLLIIVALAVYGVYAASFLPALLVGGSVPALLIGFALQAVCALAAALGVWRGGRWAAGAVVLLGICVAATWLFEGFILGIVAYLRALLVAVIALLITFIIAAYLNREMRSSAVSPRQPR
jgi:TRAP-type C4-dicarboxylate transport system permease large subunit